MNVGNVTGATALPTQTKSSELGEEGFLKMLLAQLKIQDPSKPFDASTMMQQISQLTGLASAQKLSDSVDDLKKTTNVSQMLDASQLVGKQVQLSTDVLELQDAKEAKGSVMVPEGVDTIEITVINKSGNPIKTISMTALGSGVHDFSWDGLNNEGKAVSEGFYSFSAVGKSGNQSMPLYTAANYTVKSVALDRARGGIVLNVNGLGGVSINDIIKVL